MRRRAALGAIGTGLAAGVAGCLQEVLTPTATQAFERREPVAPGTAVEVANRNGPVRVEPTSGDQLVIHGERRAADEAALETIRIEVASGDPVVIRVVHEGDGDWRAREVDLTVELPPGVDLAEATTANGAVSVRDVGGDPYVLATNGAVDAAGVEGFVRGESTNGDVTIRDVGGLDGARSRNGDLDLEARALRRDVTAETVNGDVAVRIDAALAATVRLRTSNGTVDVEDLPVTETSSSSTRFDGHLGGAGGPTLTLLTTNGDVRLRPV
ncbi:MAG: DUF4097 family beta strand repeat-containing protein [Halobacteriota archaeon]